MDKTKWTRTLKYVLLGATGFWLPDIFQHAVRAHKFNSRDVQIITVVMPLTFLGTYLAAKWASRGARPGRIGLSMLAGVWLLGGFCVTINASFSGGGFMGPDGTRGAALLILLSLFPIYTFIMATYDGALGALLLVTAVAFLMWIFHLSESLLHFGGKSHTTKSP
jgi:hypothetical protein